MEFKTGELIYVPEAYGTDPIEVIGISWDNVSYRLKNTVNGMIFSMPVSSDYWMDKHPIPQYNKVWNSLNGS